MGTRARHIFGELVAGIHPSLHTVADEPPRDVGQEGEAILASVAALSVERSIDQRHTTVEVVLREVAASEPELACAEDVTVLSDIRRVLFAVKTLRSLVTQSVATLVGDISPYLKRHANDLLAAAQKQAVERGEVLDNTLFAVSDCDGYGGGDQAVVQMKDGALALLYALTLRFLVDVLSVARERDARTEVGVVTAVDLVLPGAAELADETLRTTASMLHHVPTAPSMGAILAAAGVPRDTEPIDVLYRRRIPAIVAMVRHAAQSHGRSAVHVGAGLVVELFMAVIQNVEKLERDPANANGQEYVQSLRRYAVLKCTALAADIEVTYTRNASGDETVGAKISSVQKLRQLATEQRERIKGPPRIPESGPPTTGDSCEPEEKLQRLDIAQEEAEEAEEAFPDDVITVREQSV